MSIFLVFVLSLGSLAMARAKLEFEETAVELKAKPSDERLLTTFKFKNTGDEKVKISKISIGCSCMKAAADKEIYAPGESGQIDVVFKLGSFTGHNSKTMTVVAGEQRTRLRVGVQIPNVITITPNVLEWYMGDKLEPKKFTVKVEHPDPINITEMKASREGFDPELKVIKEGREYEITLTPESIEVGMLGYLRLTTDCKLKKHKNQMAFFAISRKPKETPAKEPTPKK